MSHPAACLFDLDGLLLDTEPLHGRAWRQAAREFGLELSDQQLLALRGRRRLDNASRVIAWIGAAGRLPPTTEQLCRSACWAFADSLAGAQAALAAGAVVHVLLPDGLGREHDPQEVRCLRSLAELELSGPGLSR